MNRMRITVTNIGKGKGNREKGKQKKVGVKGNSKRYKNGKNYRKLKNV